MGRNVGGRNGRLGAYGRVGRPAGGQDGRAAPPERAGATDRRDDHPEPTDHLGVPG